MQAISLYRQKSFWSRSNFAHIVHFDFPEKRLFNISDSLDVSQTFTSNTNLLYLGASLLIHLLHILQDQNLQSFSRRSICVATSERQTANVLLQVHYLKDPAPDYIKAAVHYVTEFHCGSLPGDILVFLTGRF